MPASFKESFGRFIRRWHRSAGIGLDVGSFSVRAVRLEQAGETLRLTHRVATPLAQRSDRAAQVEAIRKALQSIPLKDASLVSALSGPGTVVRLIVLPRMTGEELKQAIVYEAEKYIPFKVEEAYLDSAVVANRPDGQMDVVIAAAKKEVVDAHLQLMTEAGASPRVLDLEALALAHAWEAFPPADGQTESEQVTALLHVGARMTLLDIFLGNRFQFAREIALAGDAFIQAAQETLRLDALGAKPLQCEPDHWTDEVIQAMLPVWEDWLSECRRSFDFYENQSGRRVERLVLSGGSARSVPFRRWVEETTGFPVLAWEPGEDQACGDWAIAMGLARRGLVE